LIVRRKLITLMLLLAVTPSASELLEWGVHAVLHGDFAHADDGHHEESGEEHGCTALLHACGCHRGVAATESGAASPARMRHERACLPEPDAHVGRAADPPALRPPIA
jgi:hypothetical protein